MMLLDDVQKAQSGSGDEEIDGGTRPSAATTKASPPWHAPPALLA
jgi:hypothetical protein